MDKRLLCAENYFFKGWRSAATLALGLLIVTALAPQVYGQATVSGGSFETDEYETPFTLSPAGTLNYFDSNLGTLTGVEITYKVFGTTEINIGNTHASQDMSVNILETTLDMLFSSVDPDIQNVLIENLGLTPMISGAIPVPGVNPFNPLIVEPGGTYGTDELTGENDVLFEITDLSLLNAFIGSGTFELGCQAIAGITTNVTGGNMTQSQDTDAGCGVEITYNYEPNPIEITVGPCWRTLSSPVQQTWAEFFESFETDGTNHGGLWTQGVPGARTTSGEPNVYTMNADGNAWVPVTNLNTTIPAGTGVVISVFADDNPGWPVVDNPGSPSYGFNKTSRITGTELGRPANVNFGVDEGTTLSSGGFSMLGNPYETAIDFNLVDASGIEGAVWVYNRNAGGTSPNGNAGGWVSFNGELGDLEDGLIAAGQGFLVQNTSVPNGPPSVNIGEEAKVYEVVDFYGKKADKPDHFRMEVRGEDVYSSAWVQLSHNGSLTENIRGDVTQFYPYETEYAVLSTVKQGSMLDIGHFPYPDEETSIPLTIETTSNAPMTLTLTDLNVGISAPLYLHDTVTGESIELTEGAEYTFYPEGTNILAKAVDGCLTAPGPLTGPGGMNKAVSPRFLINTNATLNNGGSDLPTTFTLEQNYPNPFNPTTQITYQLPEQSQVTLSVYDMAGRQVATLINENVSAGIHTVNFDASSLSSGVYMYRLNTGSTMLTRKLTLIK